MENRMLVLPLLVVVCLLVFAVHFALYLTGLSSMMLIEQQELDVSEELTSTTGCCGRGLNRRPLSLWASTLPLSYPATLVKTRFNVLYFKT